MSLELEDSAFERLDRVLPHVEHSKKQMISFKCKDQHDHEKEVKHQVDPWGLLEGYPNGQLSPNYFAGNVIDRTNVTYMKSPFDAPENDDMVE